MKFQLHRLDLEHGLRLVIIEALKTCPSLDAAAHVLGVTPRALQRLLTKHRLKTRAQRLMKAHAAAARRKRSR